LIKVLNQRSYNKTLQLNITKKMNKRLYISLPMESFWSKEVHNGGSIKVEILDPKRVSNVIETKLAKWPLCE